MIPFDSLGLELVEEHLLSYLCLCRLNVYIDHQKANVCMNVSHLDSHEFLCAM